MKMEHLLKNSEKGVTTNVVLTIALSFLPCYPIIYHKHQNTSARA